MGFLSDANSLLGKLTTGLNNITSGGGGHPAGRPSSPSPPDSSGGKSGNLGAVTASIDTWGTKLLDVLQDMNRGVWSLVNAIESGHLGGGGGAGGGTLDKFQAMMPSGPFDLFKPKLEGGDEEKDKEGWMGKITKWAGKVLPAMTDRNEMRGISNTANATADLVEKVPVVGQTASTVLKFGAALAKAVDQVQQWTNALHDNNMQFAEFSGAMSAVKARDEMRQIKISRERGDRRAKSAEYLAESKSTLDRNTSKTRDAWGSLGNVIIGGIADIIGKVYKPLDDGVGYLAQLVGLTTPDKDKPSNFQMWKDWIGDEGIDNYAVPPRLKGGAGNS